MSIPADLRYTAEHEWVAVVDGQVRVGVTAHAATELGDIVFVELPEPGTRVVAGHVAGEIESTKSVSELFAPIDGEIVEINTAVVDDPALVNADAYAAWLYVVAPDDPATIDSLLDAAAYASLVGA